MRISTGNTGVHEDNGQRCNLLGTNIQIRSPVLPVEILL